MPYASGRNDRGLRVQKLDETGFRKVLKAIEVLTEDLEYDSFPRRAVNAIATAVAVDFVAYNEVDLAGGGSRFFLRPDPAAFDPGSAEYAAFVRRFGNHPAIAQKIAASGDANPDLQRFVNRLRLMGMVGNCCGEAELRLNIGLTVASSSSRRIGVSIHRSVRDFDDRDAAALEALKPHIVAAYKNSIRADSRVPAPVPAGESRQSLTRRENEVLYWVSMGKTNEEVAEIVGAKAPTIKKHLEHIYDKLGVPNRTAAARFGAAMH